MIRQHAHELIARIIYIFLGFSLIVLTAYVNIEHVLTLIIQPLLNIMGPLKNALIYTHLAEAFLTQIYTSISVGFICSIPLAGYHLLSFLKPGLYLDEYKAARFTFLGSILLYFVGMFLAYQYVFPWFCKFFLSFQTDGLKGDIMLQYSGKIYEYVSFVLQVLTALGICVQIPFYLHVLKVNLDRKIFVVLSFIIAALISPPDVISQVTLALPLIILNEVGVFVSRWQTRVNELRTRGYAEIW